MNEWDLNLDSGTVQLIYAAISFYRQKWPGGDPQEQIDLEHLEIEFKKMVLEEQFID